MLHKPLILLRGFKNTDHMTQNLSLHAHQNETHSDKELDWWQMNNCSCSFFIVAICSKYGNSAGKDFCGEEFDHESRF